MDDPSPERRERDAIVAEHGPWVGYNIDLGPAGHTIDAGLVGTPEFCIRRVVQVVRDLCGGDLGTTRVLDLGSHEGGYAVELGLHGATVVGIEARDAHVAKARFAAHALGLDAVTFVQDDIRNVSSERLGAFDVVLCLGVLYHLGAHDAVRLLEQVHALTRRFAVLTTAVGLSADVAVDVGGGRTYHGRRYREDTAEAGASIGNDESVLPTRECLLDMLGAVGFTSVLEVQNPRVPAFDGIADTVTLVALRGAPIEYRSLPVLTPDVASGSRPSRRGPAWLSQAAHPQQGLWWRVRERVTRQWVRGVFQSRRPPGDWT